MNMWNNAVKVELDMDAGNKIDELRKLIFMHVVGCKEIEWVRWTVEQQKQDFGSLLFFGLFRSAMSLWREWDVVGMFRGK